MLSLTLRDGPSGNVIGQYNGIAHCVNTHPDYRPDGAVQLAAVMDEGEPAFYWTDGTAAAVAELERYYAEQNPWVTPFYVTLFNEATEPAR